MTYTQERLDGIAPASHAIRYSGMVDLEEDERGLVKQDQAVVAVTVSRITNVQFPVNKKSGEMTRVNTAVVSAHRVLEGEKRDVLLEMLGLEGPDALFETATREHPPDSVLKTGSGVHGPKAEPTEPPPGVDAETGEVTEPEPPDAPPEDEVFVPPVREEPKRPQSTADTPAGPQPEFDPNAGTREGVIETVGSVYDGRKRDPILEQFTA